MSAIRTLSIVGGICQQSLNKKLFHAIEDLKLAAFDFQYFDISKLPFFSQDLENDPPDIVTELKEKIRDAEAILIITPEYNRSFPGVLKNAIDWGSRPHGQNLWDEKPTALLGASIGNIGTFGAQHHLRQVFSYLNMRLLGQPEFYFNASKAFDEKGKLIDDKTKKLLTQYFEKFHDWVEFLTPERSAGDYKSSDQDGDSIYTH